VTLRRTLFVRNHGGQFGGALRMRSYAEDFMIEYCTFVENTSPYGGAAYIKHYNFRMTFRHSLFVGNAAVGDGADGGALYLDTYNPDMILFNNTFLNNRAVRKGGVLAIYSFNDIISIEQCTFEDNIATNGGAVFLDFNNFFYTFDSCVFRNNSAHNNGGAMYIDQSNNHVAFQNSVFEANSATSYSGGAIYMYLSNEHIDFADTVFSSNSVENDISTEENAQLVGSLGGGSVFSHTLNKYIIFTRTLFSDNAARLSSGGACFFRAGHHDVQFSECEFSNNYAHDNGGALNFMTFNTGVVIYNSRMQDNTAEVAAGGAICGLAFNDLHVEGSFLTANDAVFGGGIQLTYSNTAVILLNNSISHNLALLGAGVYIGISHHKVKISNCSIDSNFASVNGGGLFTAVDSILEMTGNELSSNRALQGSGGAIYYESNDLIVSSSHFNNNLAGLSGGAIYSSGSNIEMAGIGFDSNAAGSFGGALCLSAAADSNISSCSFESNIAGSHGGALALDGVSNLNLSDSSFHLNSVQVLTGAIAVLASGGGNTQEVSARVGGAIFLLSSSAVLLQTSSFSNNTGEFGSAVWTAASDLSVAENSFVGNSARGGGTLYWVWNSGMSVPGGGGSVGSIDVLSNEFSDNNASYGTTWASNGHSLRSTANAAYVLMTDGNSQGFNGGSDPIQVLDFQTPMPAVSVGLYDYYGQLVVTDSSELVTSDLSAPSTNTPSCGDSAVPAVTGETIVRLNRGVAVFSEVTAHCAPSGLLNMTMEVSTASTSSGLVGTLPQFAIARVKITVGLRTCLPGEYYKDNICIRCPFGFYSLVDNSDLSVTECSKCPEGAISCEGDTIELKEGYWRAANLSESPINCAFDSKSCVGGTGVGDHLCHEGYSGALCGVCAENYYLVGGNECIECEKNVLTISGFIGVVCSVLFFILVLLGRYIYSFDPLEIPSGRVSFHSHNEEDEEPAHHGGLEHKLYAYLGLTDYYTSYQLERQFVCISAKLAVHFGLFQVLGTLPFVLDVQFPRIFTSVFGESSNALNLNLPQLFGVKCTFKYDYVDYLVLATMLPILLSLALYVLMVISIAIVHYKYPSYSKVALNKVIPGPVVDVGSLVEDSLSALGNALKPETSPTPANGPTFFSGRTATVAPENSESVELVPLSSSPRKTPPPSVDRNESRIPEGTVERLESAPAATTPPRPVSTVPPPSGVTVASTNALSSSLINRRGTLMKAPSTRKTAIKIAESHISSIESRTASLFFLLIFVILPSTCTVIFRMFSCRNIDTDGVVEGSSEFLIADFSLSCSSERYLIGSSWALWMILVYPIGCPVLFFYVLYRKKKVIITRYEPLNSERAETLRDNELAPYIFLFNPYTPKYYYWEVRILCYIV